MWFRHKKMFEGFSPFVLGGVVVILVPIFVLMTLNNIREQEKRVVEKLTGKGIFLIRAFEAGTRTGMMSMGFGASRLQRLLTETALQPEVAYMMITTSDGRILAHSDPDRVGEQYDNMPNVSTLNDPAQLLHREVPSQNEGIAPVFQVVKKFTPAHRRSKKGRPLPPWCMKDNCLSPVEGKTILPSSPKDEIPPPPSLKDDKKMDWFRAHFFSRGQEFRKKHLENHTDQIIFAALDMSEARKESRQYLRHAIIMGVLFFVLGCAGTVIVLMIQGYRSVRSSLDLMKAEVERSRRLAAVGKLAAGVAHEIRNPLSSIKGFATWFRERYSDRDEDREVADVMIDEVERLNRAVTQLLELSKPLPVTKTLLNIEEIFAHSIKLIAQELDEKGIAVHLQVDGSLKQKEIVSDPDRLNQILLNLYLNAIQAMEEEGGTLGILATETGSGPGKSVLLVVSDTGRGINAADIDHIFDPYFTNRPGGTGLGLAMVHRAVEALDGEIRVESEKGEGTRFFIKLPTIKYENPRNCKGRNF